MNTICSFYKNVLDRPVPKQPKLTHPGRNIKMLDLLTNQGYTNYKLLNEIRNSGYKSDFYEFNKKRLSAATFSCVQEDLTVDRNDDNILFHTQYIAFDIDVADNPYLLTDGESIKEHITDNIPYVSYIGKSVSNIGYWGLFKIIDKNDHAGHYRAMVELFSKHGIEIDRKVHDISRLRFLSYDPDHYINEESEVFKDTLEPEIVTSSMPYYERPNVTDELFIAACRWVEAKHEINFQKGSIHNYLLYLMGTLRSAHVGRTQCLNWIYNNLIDEKDITTNCLDEPKWARGK